MKKRSYLAVYERSLKDEGWAKVMYMTKAKSKSHAARLGEILHKTSSYPGEWSYYDFGAKRRILRKYNHPRTFGQIRWF